MNADTTRRPFLPGVAERVAHEVHPAALPGSAEFPRVSARLGSVIDQCMARHRHQEFILLLQCSRAHDAGRQADPRHPRQLRRPTFEGTPRLARHPRWTFHFTPTSCSLGNAVETFFAALTHRRRRITGFSRDRIEIEE